MEISGDLRVGNQIQFDFDNLGEFIEIPLIRNEENTKLKENLSKCMERE